MPKRNNKIVSPATLGSLIYALLLSVPSTGHADSPSTNNFLPLPDTLFKGKSAPEAKDIKIEEIIETTGEVKPQFAAKLPDKVSIKSEGATLEVDSEKGQLRYSSNNQGIKLVTDLGTELESQDIILNSKEHEAKLDSSFALYHGDSLSLGDTGSFNWETEEALFTHLRTKINGIILKADEASYQTDENGQKYMELKNAYLSTHDVQTPSTWIGFEQMRIYPGSHGKLTGLSIGSPEDNIKVPILGWVSLSHSLNPKEGYLPMAGTKSIWGFYMLNQYGYLLGNRHVENGMPTSDYILTTHYDYRSRRGLGLGIDIEDAEMSDHYSDMTGLSIYYVPDEEPNINPTTEPREDIGSNRYRIALQSMWDFPKANSLYSNWRLKMNINILSDEYVLADYFESLSSINDKPDNTVAVTNRGKGSENTLLFRFAPNDFYNTDERVEWTNYHVRQPIGKSDFYYESRNSLGAMRQRISDASRIDYLAALADITDETVANYYKRMLNEGSYARLSTTHEFSRSHKVLDFLNITPKAGMSYNGYYSVDNVEDDNRFGAFLACDFDFKFHKQYKNVRSHIWGVDGITHTLHPYLSLSHNNINSTNELVPQINAWSSYLGGSTNTPMPLDLCGFVGPDGWSKWTLMRTGLQNALTTTYDGELFTLLRWNAFIDYNIENPVAPSSLSNLYSSLTLRPTRRISLLSETQFPFMSGGDEFSECNHTLRYQVNEFFELGLGHRYINRHQIQSDANQIKTEINLRIDENYSMAGRWYFDKELNEMPIQQYSIFRNSGAWQVGATLYLRNNGGKTESGFGLSFTLRETATSVPVNFF